MGVATRRGSTARASLGSAMLKDRRELGRCHTRCDKTSKLGHRNQHVFYEINNVKAIVARIFRDFAYR